MRNRYPYNCRDRMCGALDCNLCHPGNESYREWEQARDEYEERRAEHLRDSGLEANMILTNTHDNVPVQRTPGITTEGGMTT